jgi:DNA-binding transcriptional LysR family regulator
MEWDDLRIVLAVFRESTLSGAARRLGVTHSTVFRRLGAIEQQMGARLFERFRDGYVPTPLARPRPRQQPVLKTRC